MTQNSVSTSTVARSSERQLNFFDIMFEEENVSIKKFEENSRVERTWLFIDGNNLLNRAYFATAQRLKKAPDGRYTNAVELFMKMMLKHVTELNAQVAVMFDDGKGFRKELYPAYKEGRSESPPELDAQFPVIREVLETVGIPVFSSSTYEADDLIASAIRQVKGDVYILSNDKDLYQVISERVTNIVRKQSTDIYMTPALFAETYGGLQPQQIVDLKALEGDPSDNIPGVNGIGIKGALKLIQAFSSVEGLIAANEFPQNLKRYQEKIENGKKDALFAKELTTLRMDIPLTLSEYQINKQSGIEICETLAMYPVIKFLKNC